jgi:peptidoglycan/LPS O-acetylase OafA/YrhL
MTTHYHAFSRTHENTGGTQLELWWRSLFYNGAVAVDCFFVIAGFLAELPGRPFPVGGMGRLKVVISKFLRLAPVYYAGVLVFLLTVLCISASKSAKAFCIDEVNNFQLPWVSSSR